MAQVWSLVRCSALRIWHCHSSLSCNCSSALIPGLRTPFSIGQQKKRGKKKSLFSGAADSKKLPRLPVRADAVTSQNAPECPELAAGSGIQDCDFREWQPPRSLPWDLAVPWSFSFLQKTLPPYTSLIILLLPQNRHWSPNYSASWEPLQI